MLDFLKKRPMLLCAVVGCGLSVLGTLAENALFWICPLILLLIVLACFKRAKAELVLAAVLALAIALSTLVSLKAIEKANLLDDTTCTGEFVVVEKPTNKGDYYYTTVQAVDCAPIEKGTKLAVTYNSGEMQLGEYINATLSLSSMENEDLKYSFYSDRIFLRGYLKSFRHTGESDGVLTAVGSVREWIKNTIFKFYGKSEAATMLALITGDKSYFTDTFYSNVKSAGVAHVMVVSGMHLSIIIALALYFANKLFYNPYFKALVICVVTIAVMAVCGFTMSIMRAGVTYLLMALALVLGRENTPENTLGAAVSIILLCNPLAIRSVAFQLSVLSTFAILVVALPISDYLINHKIIKQNWLKTIVPMLLISLSALIFTSPVTIYVFGYVSNVSLITNLLISWAVSLAMYTCLLGFAIPFLRPVLFLFSDLLVRYINLLINFFGSLPFATTRTPGWLAFVMVGVIIIILGLLIACKERQKVLKLEEVRIKKFKERGKLKWQSLTKRS